MKCSIRKKDYLKIYNMTNNASPLGEYNCGELCDSICCTIENKNKDDIYIDISLHDAAYSKAMENCFLESQAVIKRWEKDNSKVYNRKRIRNSDIMLLMVYLKR